MARYHNPNLPTSDLAIYIDVNNPRSYNFAEDNPSPKDIKKGVESTVTMYNGPITSDSYIEFDGTNDFKRVTKDGWKGGTFAPDYVTASMWIYPKSNASTGYNSIIAVESSFLVSFRRVSTSGISLWYASNPWQYRGSSAVVAPLEKWSLITFVHGATQQKMYVNDQLVRTQNHSGPLAGGNATYPYMTLMARTNGGSSRARARFGALYLYERELSADEIAKIFYARRGKYNV